MLNNQQQAVFNRIVNLDFEKLLMVEGFPGTGKSFTVGLGIETLLLKFPDLKVVIVAPTHQALGVIFRNVPQRIREKVDFSTIHSLLGQRHFSPSLGKSAFTLGDHSKAANYDLVVVDEESMVNLMQSKILLETPSTKILTMGDPHQLGPVKAKKNIFRDFPEVELLRLTEVVRNNGEIARVSHESRSGIYYPEKSFDNVLVHDTPESLVTEFVKKVKTLKNPTDGMFLAFTNERVDEVSSLTLRALYGDTPFNVGQFLRLEQNLGSVPKGFNVQIREVLGKEEIMGFPCWKLNVFFEGSGQTIFALDDETKALRDARLEELEEEAKNCDGDLLGSIKKEYHGICDSFTEVRNPLVITINKSQGITCPHVFVDTVNVQKKARAGKKNLLCVAYSRASVELNTVAVEIPIHHTKEYSDIQTKYKAARRKIGAGTKLHWDIWEKCAEGTDLRSYEGKVHYLEIYKKHFTSASK